MKQMKYYGFLMMLVFVSATMVSCSSDSEALPEGWTKVSGIFIRYNIAKNKYLGEDSFVGYVHNNMLYSIASEDSTPIGPVSSNTKTTEGTYEVSSYAYYTRFMTNGMTQYWLYYYN